MKEMNNELKNRIMRSHSGLERMSWNEIYDTEEELINDLFSDRVKTDGPISSLCRGYEYIKSFRAYFQKNRKFTEKQMIQLKRLASEIAFNVYCK